MLDVISNADVAAFSAHGALHGNEMVEKAGIRVDARMRRGRASAINPSGRFEPEQRAVFHDGWEIEEELPVLMCMIDLDDGARMYGQVTDCKPEDLRFGMRVQAYFMSISDEAGIPKFRPV